MAVLVLAVLAGGLLLWQQPWQQEAERASTPSIPEDAASRLTAQLRSLSAARSERDFVEAAGSLPAARDFGRRTWASLRAVADGTATFRYISGADAADRPDGSTTASVEVAWTASAGSGLGADDQRLSSLLLRVVPQADGDFSIIGAERRVGPVPVWLVGPVELSEQESTVVLRVDGGDTSQSLDAMAATARRAVEEVVPEVGGDLTIVSPRTQDQMAEILGQDADAVAQIAAVTARLDDASAKQPVVVLNPQVFATMDRRAAQIVLSHEATHALTGAVGTRVANWLVEGFADFVALRRDDAPLSVSAGQVLTDVAAGRTPTALPTDADFEATQHGLGAVYESAWMVFRMLGERYPDAEIVAFYQDVIGGEPLDDALQSSFGLTVETLTAQWRAYLTKSASTMS